MAIRFDKLTVKAQQALQDAQERAAHHNHQELTGLHLLAALLNQQDGIVLPLLSPRFRARTSLSPETTGSFAI